MVQEFVCTGEQCLNCPLPDCMRDANNTIRPVKFVIDGDKVGRGNKRTQRDKRLTAELKKKEKDKAQNTAVKKQRGHRYKKKPENELIRKPLKLMEDENGKYYLRKGKNGIPYRQSIEAHERELQRQREYARKRYYELRDNSQRAAI